MDLLQPSKVNYKRILLLSKICKKILLQHPGGPYLMIKMQLNLIWEFLKQKLGNYILAGKECGNITIFSGISSGPSLVTLVTTHEPLANGLAGAQFGYYGYDQKMQLACMRL